MRKIFFYNGGLPFAKPRINSKSDGMKQCLLIILVAASWSCNSAGDTETQVDSLKRAMDTAVDKIGDSVKSKSKQMVEDIEKKVGEVKDSVKN